MVVRRRVHRLLTGTVANCEGTDASEAMAESNRPLIIKRKRGRAEGGHHGGAWKVAYADFVTAMMAFFLMMWLLNSTTVNQREGLADYFDSRIPIARVSGAGGGLFGGDSLSSSEQSGESGGGTAVMKDGRATTDGPGSDDPSGRLSVPDEAETGALGALQEALDSLHGGPAGDRLLGHMGSRMNSDGLVIEVFDTDAEPLFASGSAEPTPMLKGLVAMVAGLSDLVTNQIAITGHTDSQAFLRDGHDANWALSLERAEAARRLLVEAGLDPARIVEVTGRAATQPASDDPEDPMNRRVSITLLRAPR